MFGGAKYGKVGNKSSGLGGPSTAMAAVAFQDQLLKNLSLTNPIPNKQKLLSRPKPSWKKNVKSTIDTGLNRKQAQKKKDEEKEYVLDPKPPPPTLAQKLGLVDAPTGHLTEDDWRVVKENSNKREDSKQPCVICKEDFGTDPQVLLSCTHVFHRACLEAFERFTGKKTCPLCRKEQYQKRVIHDGVRHHRQVCATRIQAMWRGYVVRKWYKNLRETVPPKDPMLRTKFYEKRLKTITDRMVNSYDTDVHAFLREIDASLENSRQVFEQFDETQRIISDDEWSNAQLKAVERGDVDCPICLNALAGGNTGMTARTEKPAKRSANADNTKSQDEPTVRKTVLLSCSHVFHQTCFEALEEFAIGERRFVCPVCRCNYQKRIL